MLGTHGAAIARTLEQKISDAGPLNQRIDPHILIPARNDLVDEGTLLRIKRHGVDWYALADTPNEVITERIEEQFEVYRLLLAGGFNARLGQVMEIAVFRALQQSGLQSLGGFRSLSKEPTTTKQKKEEPPSILNTMELSGNKRFDFIVGIGGQWAGLEVKNVREWLYPDREEIRDLLLKAVQLNIPPILVARRIPFVTRMLLAQAGAILWETRHQYYPPEHDNLAGQVRAKLSLGYFDVQATDAPDAGLLDFITRIIPENLSQAVERFEAHRDLLTAYAIGEMSYAAFAARIRRRATGENEDSDENEDLTDVPF